MNGEGFVINEAYSVLAIFSEAFSRRNNQHTATVCSPHFDVSALRLFLLTDHSRGVTRSVAIYIYVSDFLDG